MDNKHIGHLVLSSDQVQAGVENVAAQINDAFMGKDVVVITIVPGGILFTADLVKKLKFDVSMDYLSCPHTPGDKNNTSTIVYHQNVDITGKHVILVDDAIESGGTMKRIVAYITQEFSASSISIATLFVKPGRVDIPVKQYFSNEMENDDLLVGYGLPWNDKYRNLPFAAKLIK